MESYNAFDILQKEITLNVRKWQHVSNEELYEEIFNKRAILYTLLETQEEFINGDFENVATYYNTVKHFDCDMINLAAKEYEQSKIKFCEKNSLMITHKINTYIRKDYYLDMFNECMLSLQKSFNQYNHGSDASIETFCFLYINFAIRNFLKTISMIKLSEHTRKIIRRVASLKSQNDLITLSQCIDLLGDEFEYEDIKEAYELQHLELLSLNNEINKDDNVSEYIELIEGTERDVLDNEKDNDLIHKNIIEILNGRLFSDRDRDIIRMRFGIGLTDSYTLEEIAQQFGLTRERIRQIESKALNHLRTTYGDRMRQLM